MNKLLMVTLIAIFCLVISVMTFVPKVINEVTNKDTNKDNKEDTAPDTAPTHTPDPSSVDTLKYRFQVVKDPEGGVRVYIIFKDVQSGSISAIEYVVIVDPRMNSSPIPDLPPIPEPTPKSPIE